MSNENLTENTLADVQAGIPARDAEIETLRKENAELREQLEEIGAGGVSGKLMPGAAPRNSEILDLAISQGMTANEGVYCGSAATILCFAGALTRSTKPDQAQPMKVTSHETIDWTEISKRGLLERINREIMHPLGLAVYRCVETGVSGGALVSPDGVWTYEVDSAKAQQVDRSTEMQGTPVDNPLDLQGHASVIFSKAVAWADARVEAALIQEQGKPHGKACDEAAQTHFDLVLALRNLQSVQQPVSGADLTRDAEIKALDEAWKNEICHAVGEYTAAKIAWLRRAALAQQDASRQVAGSVREPVNGNGWRVHWWNESMRLMLPEGSRIHHHNIFGNGTMVITIKTDAARKEQA